MRARFPSGPVLSLGGLGVVCGLAFAVVAPSRPGGTPDEPAFEPTRHQSYAERIPGSKVHFEMIAVPGGTFRMGSPRTEKGRGADEGPQYLVRVRPFWVGRCEVTWDEYDLFRDGGVPSDEDNDKARAKDVDAITRPTQPYPDETRCFGREGYPVVGISHHAAMEYCRWLSRKTGKVYRLPTEAEWEYACRARTTTAYSFGNDAADLGEYAWFDTNSRESTQPVGKKQPNPWGLCDTYGNVAEWCLDHYDKDMYGHAKANRLSISPVKWPTADRFSHVVRGGSWADGPGQCRSATRRGSDPSWNKMDPDIPKSIWWLWDADFVGFRLVRAVEEETALKGIRSLVTKKSK